MNEFDRQTLHDEALKWTALAERFEAQNTASDEAFAASPQICEAIDEIIAALEARCDPIAERNVMVHALIGQKARVRVYRLRQRVDEIRALLEAEDE